MKKFTLLIFIFLLPFKGFSQSTDEGIYLVTPWYSSDYIFYIYSNGTDYSLQTFPSNLARSSWRPNVAFFLNKLYIVNRGYNTTHIYISTSPNIGSWSSNIYLGNGANSSSSPKVLPFKNKLFIFHKGASTNTIYVCSSYDGANWSSDLHLGNGAKTSASPEVVVFNDKLYLFHKGQSNDNIYVCSSSDGATWSSDLYLGNGATTDDPFGMSVVEFNNKLYMFYRSTNDKIYFCSSSNGSDWSSYQQIFSSSTYASPTAVVFNGKIYVYIRDSGFIPYYFTSTDGVNWLGLNTLDDSGYYTEYGYGACTYDFKSYEGSNLTVPFTRSGSTVGNTNDWDVSGSDGSDATYEFYVSGTKTLDITLCSSNTNYDTKLELYYADMTSTGYYNDDASCSYGNLKSTISSVTLEEGYYYIVVDGYGGATGNYYLSVSESGLKSTKSSNDENIYDPQYEREKDLMPPIKEESLNIYPNPASKITTIEGSDVIEGLKIYNLSGELIGNYSPYSNQYTLDISAFSSGNYILKIIYQDMVETKKLIIQH